MPRILIAALVMLSATTACSLAARHEACLAGDADACRSARESAAQQCARAESGDARISDRDARQVASACHTLATLEADGLGGPADAIAAAEHLDLACDYGLTDLCDDATDAWMVPCLQGDDTSCQKAARNASWDCGDGGESGRCDLIVDSFPAMCGDPTRSLTMTCDRLRDTLTTACDKRRHRQACPALIEADVALAAASPDELDDIAYRLTPLCRDRGPHCLAALDPHLEPCLHDPAASPYCPLTTELADTLCEHGSAVACALDAGNHPDDASARQARLERACESGYSPGCQMARQHAIAHYDPQSACLHRHYLHERLLCAQARAASTASGGARTELAQRVVADREAAVLAEREALEQKLARLADQTIDLAHDDFDDLWRLRLRLPYADDALSCDGCYDASLWLVWLNKKGREEYALVVHFTAESWLFLDELTIEIDGKRTSFDAPRKALRDGEVLGGGDIEEHLYVPVKRSFVKKLVDADTIAWRARGSEGNITAVHGAAQWMLLQAWWTRLTEVRKAL